MKVVHCKLDPFDIYVGRPSKWGNPFNLKDKILGCWCAPKDGINMDDELICHAQILARIANQ